MDQVYCVLLNDEIGQVFQVLVNGFLQLHVGRSPQTILWENVINKFRLYNVHIIQ